jgi:uncharacterized protein
MRQIYWISLVLAVIGGINWGLVGLFNFDLVGALFGEMSAFTRIVYSLIGLAALTLFIVSCTRAREITDDLRHARAVH